MLMCFITPLGARSNGGASRLIVAGSLASLDIAVGAVDTDSLTVADETCGAADHPPVRSDLCHCPAL
jgi:hypothetical protein